MFIKTIVVEMLLAFHIILFLQSRWKKIKT